MGQNIYYAMLFASSLMLSLFYVFIWHKQFNVDMTAFFVIMPLINLSYFLLYSQHEMIATTALLLFVFAGACFLPWYTTMCELNLCQIHISRTMRMASFLLCSSIFLCDLVFVRTDLLYRSIEWVQVGSAWALDKEYGSFQIVHYIFVLLFFCVDLGAIIYSSRKRKQVSRIVLILLSVPIFVTMLGYLAGSPLARAGYELTPLTYVLAQIIYLLIVTRMAYYNVSEMVIESMVESGDVGFVTVDSKGRYLGSNETARRIIPELGSMTVDRTIHEKNVISWIEQFRKNGDRDSFVFSSEDETIYRVRVSNLYYGKRRCGFQIFIADDTANQKYIQLLDHYNEELQEEVRTKTERLVAMNDQFILGMAMMVGNRDNSTGGHIKRTSECVRILTEEIKAGGSFALPDSFYEKLVKAAPMHDLGKIAVDDAILRKPGRYTDEEYAVMKTHAAEGARIVHELLKDSEDEEFRQIAENIAHYHHERFDGSGYPEGLKGDEIPLEARIMAIADVYDALVSRRSYKESYSFEKADRIILSGMGTQFDERLQRFYQAARERLEEYYARNLS